MFRIWPIILKRDPAARPESGATAGSAQGAERRYTLSDDVARLCLPREFKDSHRKLAYANSICALFLIVGLVGLKTPQTIARSQGRELPDPVPVVFMDPLEPPGRSILSMQEDPEDIIDQPVRTIDIPVVAPVDAADVAFPVPVEGRVAVAPSARFVPPPPPAIATPEPAAPVNLNLDSLRTTQGGSYPPPAYPEVALRNRQQGTVTVEIFVGPDGAVTGTRIQSSSGHRALDEAAVEVVEKRWRFPAGSPRHYSWACVFQLR
jgi:TonB family protein